MYWSPPLPTLVPPPKWLPVAALSIWMCARNNGRERAVPLCFNPGLPLPFFLKEQVIVSRMAGVVFNYLFIFLLLKIMSCSPLPSFFPEPIATELLHSWDKILWNQSFDHVFWFWVRLQNQKGGLQTQDCAYLLCLGIVFWWPTKRLAVGRLNWFTLPDKPHLNAAYNFIEEVTNIQRNDTCIALGQQELYFLNLDSISFCHLLLGNWVWVVTRYQTPSCFLFGKWGTLEKKTYPPESWNSLSFHFFWPIL